MSHLGRLEGEQPQLMTLQVTILPGLFSKFFLETMLTKIGETAKQKPRKLAPQREPMEF